MVNYPYDPNAEYAARKMFEEMRRVEALRERLTRESEQSVRRYRAALATGRFDRAAKMAEAPFRLRSPILERIGLPTSISPKVMVPYQGSELRRGISPLFKVIIDVATRMKASKTFPRKVGKMLNLQRFISLIDKAGGAGLNSPLLDLFGPVQMNEIMRKTSPRRKYLRKEEDGGA